MPILTARLFDFLVDAGERARADAAVEVDLDASGTLHDVGERIQRSDGPRQLATSAASREGWTGSRRWERMSSG